MKKIIHFVYPILALAVVGWVIINLFTEAHAGSSNFREINLPESQTFPMAITEDSFGNIWFVKRDSAKIVRLSGAFGNAPSMTEYTVPRNDVFLTGIAVDNQGNIWVGELANGPVLAMVESGILKFDPATNTFTEWKIPARGYATGTFAPLAVAVHPSGHVWMTYSGGNRIAELYPDTDPISPNTLIEYDLPAPSAAFGTNFSPVGLAIHPVTGDVYVAEGYLANVISRFSLSSSGGFTATAMFPIPDPYGIGLTGVIRPGVTEIIGMAFDAQKHLWFNAGAPLELDDLGSYCTLTAYPLPAGGAPLGGDIGGPAKKWWFLQPGSNQIGQVDAPTVTSHFTVYSQPFFVTTPVPLPIPPIPKSANPLPGLISVSPTSATNVPTGGFNFYTIPTANSGPSGIVVRGNHIVVTEELQNYGQPDKIVVLRP